MKERQKRGRRIVCSNRVYLRVLLLCTLLSIFGPFFHDIPIPKPSLTSYMYNNNNGSTRNATTTENNNDHADNDDRNNNNNNDDNTTFSACLLVMDDNHFLIEWLAYHYFVLPLRYVIVAVDPRSRTSPSAILDRWRHAGNDMTILEWSDQDYMTKHALVDAEQRAMYNFGTSIHPKLIRHRARQRLFYYQCMLKLKQMNRSWTILTDTDEFLRLNMKRITNMTTTNKASFYDSTSLTFPSMQQPASIMNYMQQQQATDSSSLPPCIQIPRIRFGIKEDDTITSTSIPIGFNSSTFQTLRWRNHASPNDFNKNKISKVIIDLRQVPLKDLAPVISIHRPIKSLCGHRKLYIKATESNLIINHYLGTWEQYSYRKDSRVAAVAYSSNSSNTKDVARGQKEFNKYKSIHWGTNDEIRSWINGFVQSMGDSQAKLLLRGVGVLEQDKDLDFTQEQEQQQVGFQGHDRCALLFYGYPLSFQDMVLPTITKNILLPNVIEEHYCDVYIHYYHQIKEEEEEEMLFSDSGQTRDNNNNKKRNNHNDYTNDPGEVLSFEKQIYSLLKKGRKGKRKRMPLIEFAMDTESDFEIQHNQTMQQFYNHDNNNHIFYNDLKAIMRQWHSINKVWELMERTVSNSNGGSISNHFYSHVGMFPLDVLYVSSIDIYKSRNEDNSSNNNHPFAVVVGGPSKSDANMFKDSNGDAENGNQNIEFGHQELRSFSSSRVDSLIKHHQHRMMMYGSYEVIKVLATKVLGFLTTEQHQELVSSSYRNENDYYNNLEATIWNEKILPIIQKQTGTTPTNTDIIVKYDNTDCFFFPIAPNFSVLVPDSNSCGIASSDSTGTVDITNNNNNQNDYNNNIPRKTTINNGQLVETLLQRPCILRSKSISSTETHRPYSAYQCNPQV